MRGEAKQSFSPIRLIIMQYCLNPRNQVPILIDDGTLDYVVQLPSGRQERFDRDYVWDAFASHSGIVATLPDNLAELLAREIDEI